MKQGQLYILLILLIWISIIQCESTSSGDPPEKESSDYRDQFCGDFSFRVVEWHWMMNHNTSYDDTLFYQGSVTKVEDADTLIRIRYLESGIFCYGRDDTIYSYYIEPEVDSNGIFQNGRIIGCSHYSDFSGSFINQDSLYFRINAGTGGGLGRKEGYNVSGRKVH